MCKWIPLMAALSALVGAGACSAQGSFQMRQDRLEVTTPTLRLVLQGGVVTGLEARQFGETFSSNADSDEAGATVTTQARRKVERRPPAKAPGQFTQAGQNEGVLVYRTLAGGSAGDEMRIGIRVEGNGDVSLRPEINVRDRAHVDEVRLPFAGLRSQAVILGNGMRFSRDMPAGTQRAVQFDGNLYSPPVAVIEGSRGVIGIWPQDDGISYDDMEVIHRPDSDQEVPQASLPRGLLDPDTANQPGLARSSWFRVAPLASWVEVARRYRADFEAASGAKPLWQQTPEWVRGIHAVSTDVPNTNTEADANKYYAGLAAKLDPKKLLLFYWNGTSLIMFGDPTYFTNFRRPKAHEIDALKRTGFRWMGYHPYVLINSPLGMQFRTEEAKRRGWQAPEGWTFKPVYQGPPNADAFLNFFRPIAAGYYGTLDRAPINWVLHPGAKKTRDYLVRNFGDYVKTHQMSGNYLDIMGADHGYMFAENAPEDRRIIEGNDWRRGEALVARALKEAYPDQALVSEALGAWVTPHVFYTWEGPTHVTRGGGVNHPIRTALWGSYTWTRSDQTESRQNADDLALLGGLPDAHLDDEWSMARAKLYADEELFNDLPARWDPEALAYYRSKSGNWFQFRRMPWGFAYVEQTAAGQQMRLGQIVKQSTFPLAQSATIEDWVAYRDGKPIGLDPTQTYNFIAGAPPAGNFRITDLPAGVTIAGVRGSDTHTVVEFGSTSGARQITVPITFARNAMCASSGQKGFQGPFAAGSSQEFAVSAPGALVLQWQQPRGIGRQVAATFGRNSGHQHANGLPYSFYTPNGVIRRTEFRGRGAAVNALELGPGLHTAYAEQWVQLAEGARPVLRFDVGYFPPQGASAPAARPLEVAIAVNGQILWRETFTAAADWRPREVPLGDFAGRQVLLTFVASEVTRENVRPALGVDSLMRLGNPRIENNP